MKPRILKIGHRGSDVLAWQQFLVAQGFKQVGKPDSIFGGNTAKATIAFQEANGVLPSGTLSESTLAAAVKLGFKPVKLTDLSTIVELPPMDEINNGLSPLRASTLTKHFGVPGKLTEDCSAILNAKLKKETVTKNVGPFKVTGWEPAVNDLIEIFKRVKESQPEAHSQVRTAGMSCVRKIKNPGSKSFSNHSWGTAVDLFFGADVDERDNSTAQLGLLLMAPIFNEAKWFWGAEFSVEDSMHFELSEERFAELKNA